MVVLIMRFNQDYVWSANYSGTNGTAQHQHLMELVQKKMGMLKGAQLVLNFPGRFIRTHCIYGGCGGGSAHIYHCLMDIL